MSKRYLSFKHLMYADGEVITSFKLNQGKALFESMRLLNGPYSVSVYEQTNSETFQLELNESAADVGGLYNELGLQKTCRHFRVFYATKESATSDYGCWDDVQFSYLGGRLLATLASGDNVYNNNLDVSAVYSDAFECCRASGVC